MEATILINQIFTDALSKLKPEYLDKLKPTNYEIFRAINIYTLDSYYKAFSFKENTLNISTSLLNNFDKVIAEAIRLLKKEYYPQDRILLIYGYLCYHTIINSKVDLAKLQNSLIESKSIYEKELIRNYSKGYFKLDLVSSDFLDELIRKTIMYPGSIDYYKKANHIKYYFIHNFSGTKSKFKAFILKAINKIFKCSFKLETEKIDNFTEIYNNLVDEIVKLLDAFNNYLYFNKEKQFLELIGTEAKS